MNLAGKAVLITGGRRVGGDLARRLAARGARVAMTYRTSRDAIEATIAEVVAIGSEGIAVEADLAIASDAARAVEQMVGAFGRIDVLVNMASIYRQTPFDSLQPADFDAMIAANLAAPYHSAVAAAKQMLLQDDDESGLKGKIVNVGDWAAERPGKGYLPYLIAKGALSTMTLALAKELAPHITVNSANPAMIERPEGLSDAGYDAVVAATPLRRAGSPADLNGLILYLLEGTDYATGGLYRIDGGRFLGVDAEDS